ncbi:MAG: hypothetical protein A2V70_15880 [Planctomycetes bacterium RBG_13_63_9]|nr:MAG: hypothetical protein A2V70_15880 [Planctomycetes bacterium RBG_13_63_9]
MVEGLKGLKAIIAEPQQANRKNLGCYLIAIEQILLNSEDTSDLRTACSALMTIVDKSTQGSGLAENMGFFQPYIGAACEVLLKRPGMGLDAERVALEKMLR